METTMNELYKLTLPAILRLVGYCVPFAAAFLFGWLATKGLGSYTELPDGTGVYAFQVTTTQITAAVVAFLGAPTLAITALIKGWKSRKGDAPVQVPK
jgi:hypothetical protein